MNSQHIPVQELKGSFGMGHFAQSRQTMVLQVPKQRDRLVALDLDC